MIFAIAFGFHMIILFVSLQYEYPVKIKCYYLTHASQMFSQGRLPGFRASLIRPHMQSVTFERHSWHRGNPEERSMFKKILNKKKEETDSSSDSEDETVPHVGRKEKKSSVASLKEKLVGGGPIKKESKSSVSTNYGSCSNSWSHFHTWDHSWVKFYVKAYCGLIKLANPLDHTSVQLCFELSWPRCDKTYKGQSTLQRCGREEGFGRSANISPGWTNSCKKGKFSE